MKEIFYQYADRGITVIPVNKKLPVISDWNNLDTSEDPHERIDRWFDSHKNITGLSILLGQAFNRRLSCVDIDSNDAEIVERILNNFPSAIRKIGRKGCTFFFLTDGEQQQASYRFPCPDGKGFIEVFYGNKQIVIPPSLHSVDENGEEHYYWWHDDASTLLTVDYDDLPEIPFAQIQTIPTLINSPSTRAANANLPSHLQYNEKGEADGRYGVFLSHFGRLVKKYNNRPKLSSIIVEMLDFDSKMCPKNSFFLYDTNKNRAEIKTNDRTINCVQWCNSIMRTYHKNSGASWAEESEAYPTETITFNKLTPLREKTEVDEKEEIVFDVNLIPEIWRKMVLEMSQATGVAPYPIYMAFLTALGASAQSKTKIQPVASDEFHQYPNMAVCLVAHSGSKKSDILAIANRECRAINRDLKKINSMKLVNEMESIQARIEALHKNKKKMASEGSMEEAAMIAEDIAKLQSELDGLGVKPTIWMYEISTIQKMISDAVKNQGNGLYLELDEFKQIIAMMKKKGNEDARTFFMKGIDGNKDFMYSTIARGSDYIEKHRISILTSIQPDVLNVYIGDMSNPRMTDNDGFFQRFQFVSFGEPSLTRPGNIDFRRYHKEYFVFRQAFNFEERVVHIDPSAMETYEDARQEIRTRAFEFYGKPVGSFLSKHEGLLCRYAYLIQILLNGGKIVTSIQKEAVELALKTLIFIGEDTKRIFKITEGIIQRDDLEAIVKLIHSQQIKDGTTLRDAFNMMKTHVKRVLDMKDLLIELEMRGYLAIIPQSRNSSVLAINPMVYSL